MRKMRAGRTMTARSMRQRLLDYCHGPVLTDLREDEGEEMEDEAQVQHLVWRGPREREDDVPLLLGLVSLCRRRTHLCEAGTEEGKRLRRDGGGERPSVARLPDLSHRLSFLCIHADGDQFNTTAVVFLHSPPLFSPPLAHPALARPALGAPVMHTDRAPATVLRRDSCRARCPGLMSSRSRCLLPPGSKMDCSLSLSSCTPESTEH